MATKKKTGLVPQTKENARNIWLAGVGALATAVTGRQNIRFELRSAFQPLREIHSYPRFFSWTPAAQPASGSALAASIISSMRLNLTRGRPPAPAATSA